MRGPAASHPPTLIEKEFCRCGTTSSPVYVDHCSLALLRRSLSGAGLLVGWIFGVAAITTSLSGAEVETQLTGVIDLAKVGEPGMDCLCQDLLGQYRQARHHVASRNTLIGVAVARGWQRRRRARRAGATQRRLLVDDRLRRVVDGCSPIRTSAAMRPTSRRTGSRSPSASSPGGPTRSPSSAAGDSGRRRRASTFASREVANPRPGDRIVVDGEAFVVQGEPVRDRERLVWTLEVRPA